MPTLQAVGTSVSVPNTSFDKIVYEILRYRAGDPITSGTCRSQVVCPPPPRLVPLRWEFDVAFGGIEPGDTWELTPSGKSPTLIWEVKTMSQGNPALSMMVDTDPQDSTKLYVFFAKRVNGMAAPARIGQIGGLARNQIHQIRIDAVLDERRDGVGRFSATIKGVPVAEFSGPTLVDSTDHFWCRAVYMYNEPAPCQLQRATYWRRCELICA